MQFGGGIWGSNDDDPGGFFYFISLRTSYLVLPTRYERRLLRNEDHDSFSICIKTWGTLYNSLFVFIHLPPHLSHINHIYSLPLNPHTLESLISNLRICNRWPHASSREKHPMFFGSPDEWPSRYKTSHHDGESWWGKRGGLLKLFQDNSEMVSHLEGPARSSYWIEVRLHGVISMTTAGAFLCDTGTREYREAVNVVLCCVVEHQRDPLNTCINIVISSSSFKVWTAISSYRRKSISHDFQYPVSTRPLIPPSFKRHPRNFSGS